MYSQLFNKTKVETIELTNLDRHGRVRLPSHWSLPDDDFMMVSSDPDAHVFVVTEKYTKKNRLFFYQGTRRAFVDLVGAGDDSVSRLC